VPVEPVELEVPVEPVDPGVEVPPKSDLFCDMSLSPSIEFSLIAILLKMLSGLSVIAVEQTMCRVGVARESQNG
jgi:hypothetical protein